MAKKAVVFFLIFLIFVGGTLIYLVLTGSELNIEKLPVVEEFIEKVVEDIQEEDLSKVEFGFRVSDPSPGKEIVIDRVATSAKGFVVVYYKEVDKRGDVFVVSELFDRGENKDIKIDLPRQIFRGEEFIVALHSDNGDGEFGDPLNEDFPMMEMTDMGSQPITRVIKVKQN